MLEKGEVIKNVDTYDDYIASNNGFIYKNDTLKKNGKSKHRTLNSEKLIKGNIGKRGYYNCHIVNNNKGRLTYTHRLICYAFYGYSDLVINHKDGCKINNKPENLEFLTAEQNIIHANTVLNNKKRGAYKNNHKNGLIWYSRICLNGKDKVLGSYKTKEEAHEAYREVYIKYYGEEPWII